MKQYTTMEYSYSISYIVEVKTVHGMWPWFWKSNTTLTSVQGKKTIGSMYLIQYIESNVLSIHYEEQQTS